MYKLAFFVPKEEKETVKEALFTIGVGKYNNYDKCSWEILGTGQFRALSGANPHIGTIGEVETLEEYKVEMICSDELIQKAVEKLKDAHPYEEVAYEVIKLEEF